MLWNVVARLAGWPPCGVHSTTEFCTKLVPFTCNVRAGEPATAVAGTSEAIVGTSDPVIVNVRGTDAEVGEFITRTLAAPGVASSAAGTVAMRTAELW